MEIIKLSAIDSTNSFLKELAQNSTLEDYTVATTNKQTSGRGQMNNLWHSEPYKNLTFSVFTNIKSLKIEHQTYLNLGVSLAVFEVLNSMSVPNLTIKWPNDIMSGNQKICGILIETTLTGNHVKNTVIGIGLNVNQQNFPKYLKNAESLKNILQKDFDLDVLLRLLVKKLQSKIHQIEEGNFQNIYEKYHDVLYKRGIPSTFKNQKTNALFMGIIKEVSLKGSIQIQLENDSIVEFDVKEISFAKE